MKPDQLKEGDRFRIPDACDPAETIDEWTVRSISTKSTHVPDFTNLDGTKGKTFVTRVDIDAVRAADGVSVPLSIGPWVEVELLAATPPKG